MYADLNSWIYDRSPFENIFDSVGFAYVLIFSKNDCPKISRFHHRKFFENARRYLSVLGVVPKTFKKNRCLVGPELRNFRFFDVPD